MRAKTVVVVTGAAIVVAALWIWRGAGLARREAEAQRAVLAARKEALAVEARRLESMIAAAEQARKAVPAAGPTSGANPSSPAKTAASIPAGQPAAVRIPTPADRAATDPYLRSLEPRYQRAIFNGTYGEFFAERGLSEEQIQRFIAAKMKRADLRVELGDVARTQDADGRRAVLTLQRQADADLDLAIAQLFGAETQRALEEYERTLSVRTGLVNSFAGTAALAGLPITAEQGERLLLAAVTAGADGGTTAESGARRTLDIAMLDAQAQQILTPEQFQLFVRTNFSRKNAEAAVVLKQAQQLEVQRRAEQWPAEVTPGR